MMISKGSKVSYNAPGLKGTGVVLSIRTSHWTGKTLIRIKRDDGMADIELPMEWVVLSKLS